MSNQKPPLLAFFGHHKAGSTWILNIINSVCKAASLKHDHFHSPKMFDSDLNNIVKKEKLNFVSYTSADVKYIKNLDNFKGFHVVRDPRDMAVSAYFSNLNSHPTQHWSELVEHREKLRKLPKDEGLLQDFIFMSDLKVEGLNLKLWDCMENWDYSNPNILEVKFEDLIENPQYHFVEIFKFLGIVDDYTAQTKGIVQYIIRELSEIFLPKGLPTSSNYSARKIPRWSLLDIIYQNDFLLLSGGRKKGEENTKSHYRKGKSGDWKNHFKDKHKEFFKKYYGGLLIKLGYERNYNW